MGPGQDERYPDEASQRAGRDSNPDALGPQGAALIFELQRLRRAFDRDIRGH